MVQYPEAQHRAQEAIDAVVGRDRFPNFEDRPALPIIDALIRETLRRAPALPVDLPHGVTDDDIYEGYFISKGSAILHDEVRFVNPMKFDPDRFLDANGQLTNDHSHLLVFGFGRRMCPGRHLADASLWSAMACMLAMFDFARAKDAQGREINIDDAEWSNGLTR
ncbi:cytochrome P450 [Coniophora puteana RWD-64-598 SS2]|uniref:Cytochrome P450 n=1 Tax=Coniophora puteana (strain RWD-64-598) TaxID=741705 RepID=A0A5M3MXK2_CONPW|nr:cytochrome P450 [Coniophora puteana RWD-64-598 SS2]EIW83820.1 cytochrome P450 [Coniophora puteana RWD-64-598 SS2]